MSWQLSTPTDTQVLFQKKTNMKLLFIQNVCILNNCKDRDQLIICRVQPFLSSVEFLHPMYLDSFKYQLCSFGNIKCVQTYVPGFNMYYLEIGPKYSSFVKQNHMSWPIIFCFLNQTTHSSFWIQKTQVVCPRDYCICKPQQPFF